MMKRIKKLLSYVTMITILLSFCFTAYAAPASAFEKGKGSTRQLVNVVKYIEETDLKVLSLMAKNSNNRDLMDKINKKPAILSNKPELQTKFKIGMVKQLLERRIFSDKSIEEDYVINVIFEPDSSLYFDDTAGKYDMSFVLSGYVTEFDDGTGRQRKCTKITTQYTKHGSIPIYVSKNVLEFHAACALKEISYDDAVTYNSPSSGVSYSYYPNFSVYMIYFSLMDSASTYTFTDGTSLMLYVDFLQL